MGSRDVLALRHQWSEDGIHGLGFGEDDAESGHQITEPVGAGGKDMSALVKSVRTQGCPHLGRAVKKARRSGVSMKPRSSSIG